MKIYNPATEDLIKEIAEDTAQSLIGKLQLAQKGTVAWREIALSERLEIIKEFGRLVQEDIDNLAAILTSEMGKPIQQAQNEIRGAHNRIDHLLKEANKWLRSETVFEDGAMKESIVYEPLGVIANISAWNYPYNVGYNVFLYALAAGNSVLYKPSEFSTLTGLAIADHLHQAGIPKDVFQVVVGGASIGKRLLEMDFDGYFFTGSHQTGQQIAISVADKLVPLQLELGGKDPLYVMDDVTNVEQAAKNAAEGAFYNAGQSCCAVERIYVADEIYDTFLGAFIQEVNTYQSGDPMDPNTFIGPLTRENQLHVLEAQVSDAVTKGAILHAGGKKRAGQGFYFEPTVLSNVNHTMLLMKEESFGPIIGIQKVSSDEEAIHLMNDTEFGLTAAVFGQNEKRVQNILGQLDTGTVYWNCCDRVSPYLPWSGRKKSGMGSTLSYQGIRAFVHPKAYQIRF